jgi:ABC-type multidrug transport system fused ATPase/permease subunit
MFVIRKYFSYTWNRLSAQGRKLVTMYSLGLFLSVFIDAAGLWMIAKSSILWINENNEPIDGDVGRFAILGLILFVLRSAIIGLSSFVSFRLLVNDEVDLSLQNYDSIQAMPYESARDIPFSAFFDTTQQSPQVAIHTVILNSISVIVGFLNILLIFILIWFFDPVVSIGTFLYFAVLGLFQQNMLSKASGRIGVNRQISFENYQNNLLLAFRLSKVFRIMESKTFRHKLQTSRSATSKALVDTKLIQLVPRLTLEIGLALGVLLLYGLNKLVGEAKSDELGIILFLLAGFRIIPILSYIQAQISTILTEIPYLIYEDNVLRTGQKISSTIKEPAVEKTVVENQDLIRLKNVSYAYSGSNVNAVESVSVGFERGKIYAIAGMPGSGKSTLLDICLGLLEPSDGSVIRIKPNLIVGYVPQNTNLFDASVSLNIALEWDDSAIDSYVLSRTLESASRISAIEGFINSDVNATDLSGGQQQLICLLRALYRDPDILFLDEATSALDSKTDSQINELLQIEKANRAIVVIAHRMSSIRNADEVIFMEFGAVKAIGDFDNIRNRVKQFELLFQEDKQ